MPKTKNSTRTLDEKKHVCNTHACVYISCVFFLSQSSYGSKDLHLIGMASLGENSSIQFGVVNFLDEAKCVHGEVCFHSTH